MNNHGNWTTVHNDANAAGDAADITDVGVAGASSAQVEGRAGGHQADTQGNLLQLRRGQ